MAKDNLEVESDDDIPPWERSTPSWERQQPAAPEVGTSPLAKQLEEDGTFDRLAFRQQVDRREEEGKGLRRLSSGRSGDGLSQVGLQDNYGPAATCPQFSRGLFALGPLLRGMQNERDATYSGERCIGRIACGEKT